MNSITRVTVNVALWTLMIVGAGTAAITIGIPFGQQLYKPTERNNTAVAALQAKQYDRAIDLLKEAVALSPDNSKFRQNLLYAYNAKAVDLDQNGKVEEAFPMFEKALEFEPKHQAILRNYISSLNNLAVEKSNGKDYPYSQKLFEKAFQRVGNLSDAKIADEIRRNYSALLTLWGDELMKHNQGSEARRAFLDSLMLDQANAVTHIRLADLFYEGNEYVEARKHYSAALVSDKENRDYLTNRIQMIDDETKIEDRFHTIKDPLGRFVIQYVDYTGGVKVSEVAELLDEAYTQTGKEIGLYPPRPLNVKIYGGNDFYAVSKLPEWAIGLFDGKIRLKTEDLKSAHSQVRDLLFHEYTHAVLAMNVRQRVPAWFHEGLAQLQEPQFSESEREQLQMRDALARKRLNFETLQDSFKDLGSKDDAESAYLLSKYFLAHLRKRYGPEKLVEWIRRVVNEESFETAFEKVYEFKLVDAQRAWIKSNTQSR